MFCEKCGTEIGDLDECPECAANKKKINTTAPAQSGQKPSSQSKPSTRATLSKKHMIALGAFIAILILVMGAVKLSNKGKSTIKKTIVGQELMLSSGDVYEIQKKDIKSLSNIKEDSYDDRHSNVETISSDILLETEDFTASGTVYIVIDGTYENIEFDLVYLPLVGVSDETVESSLEYANLNIEGVGDIHTSEYNVKVENIGGDTEDFENSSMSKTADIILEDDNFTINAALAIDLEFDRGVWIIKDIEAEETDRSYAEGKEFTFSTDDFFNEYDRGRVSINLVDDAHIKPVISKDTLKHARTEPVDLYKQKVVLDLNHETTFYDLTGEVYLYYRLANGGWELTDVQSAPIYDFKLEGNYTGWYEVPATRSYYGSPGNSARNNDATLEITKVDNYTGKYEGIFNIVDKKPNAEGLPTVLEGSYYVIGKYTPASGDKGDEWNMQSEKWITGPDGLSSTNLSGVVDHSAKMFKGDILADSDTFQLTKVK